jgi:metal-responsive CopG/Arc/MetJ family transcriptional regulator
MVLVRVVLDEESLKRVDRAAKRDKVNRSTFIRDALQEHLKRIHTREREDRDRNGYRAQPQCVDEYNWWQEVAAWPED